VGALESAALLSARKAQAGADGRIPLLSWGEGPAIVLIHGWGGRGAQLAPLALHLAQAGFRAVVPDVAGHGDSPVNEARWEWFIRDIAEVVAEVGSARALVGHSAGALAMMASRRLRGVHAERYVCISAPHHPYPPLEAIRRRLNPGEGVLEAYRAYLARQFECSWSDLETGFAWRGAGRDLLLCYDSHDKYLRSTDAEQIRSSCPQCSLMRTEQFGHTGILNADALADSIRQFVASTSDEDSSRDEPQSRRDLRS
jgi:pimeloyl-ACP methyl ester carboxylesterase